MVVYLYIVTGGAGFIGSNLVRHLLSKGHQVTVIDNFHTGSMDNLKDIMNRITLIKGNASDFNRETLRDCTGIFHIGIPSSTLMYRANRLLIGEAVNEFIKILDKYDGKIVFSSSSSVYNKCQTPYKEDMHLYPTDFYTEARISMERVAQVYREMYGNHVTALRLFSVYGSYERAKGSYANMVSQFLWTMNAGERPVIYGDGTQTRDFTHVDDVVRAFRLAMESTCEQNVFNIGTGRAYSFNDIVDRINALLRTSIQPVYRENPLCNYVDQTLADTHLAEEHLGFKYSVPLDEGIRKLMDFYFLQRK